MTKKELIQEILSLDESQEQKDLNAKTNAELEEILHGLTPAEDETISSDDIEQIKKQMYEQALKDLQEKVNKPVVKEIKESDLTINPRSNRKEQIDKQMLVPVMNVTNGKLIYQSKKTGSEFLFEHYGDIEYMEVYEILTMRSGQRRFLDEPFLIVLDDEVAEYLGLSKLYKKLKHATEIEKLFDLPTEKFKEIVETAPRGLAHLIVGKAKEKLENKQLDSVQKVKILEDIYQVELVR